MCLAEIDGDGAVRPGRRRGRRRCAARLSGARRDATSDARNGFRGARFALRRPAAGPHGRCSTCPAHIARSPDAHGRRCAHTAGCAGAWSKMPLRHGAPCYRRPPRSRHIGPQGASEMPSRGCGEALQIRGARSCRCAARQGRQRTRPGKQRRVVEQRYGVVQDATAARRALLSSPSAQPPHRPPGRIRDAVARVR